MSALGDRPAAGIKRSELLSVLDGMASKPGARRVFYSYSHHFFEWMVERELIAANPLAGIRPPRAVAPRDRVLSDAEITAVWRAHGTYADIARVCLLTAQRKGSVEAMRWKDIDLGRALWVIPASSMKSGRLHEVPLSAMAIALLEGAPRLSGPYVFGVGTDGERPYSGSFRGMQSVRAQVSELAPASVEETWRLHDLRRTAVTLAQRGGCSIEEIRALTQHKMPGVIGIYARHAYTDEKRRVADVIAAQVKHIAALAR